MRLQNRAYLASLTRARCPSCKKPCAQVRISVDLCLLGNLSTRCRAGAAASMQSHHGWHESDRLAIAPALAAVRPRRSRVFQELHSAHCVCSERRELKAQTESLGGVTLQRATAVAARLHYTPGMTRSKQHLALAECKPSFVMQLPGQSWKLPGSMNECGSIDRTSCRSNAW